MANAGKQRRFIARSLTRRRAEGLMAVFRLAAQMVLCGPGVLRYCHAAGGV